MNKLEHATCVNEYLETGDCEALDKLIFEYVKFSKKHLSTNDDGVYGVVYEALMLCLRDFDDNKASFNTRVISTLKWMLMEWKNKVSNYKWLKPKQVRLLKKLKERDDLSIKETFILDDLMKSNNSSYDYDNCDDSFKGITGFIDTTLLYDIKNILSIKEYKIFTLIQNGYTYDEIANELNVSKQYIGRLYKDDILFKLRVGLKD